MSLLRTLILFCFTFHRFVGVADAYFIDDDCTPDQKIFIKNALGNAYSLAMMGQAAIEVPSPGQAQLWTWLYGPEDAKIRNNVRCKDASTWSVKA